MNKVYITNIAKYLPNDAVSNDEMEDYLGKINDTNSKARRVVLRNNGITSRYYALTKTGEITHSNASLTTLAIKNLFTDSFSENDIEVLSCGTSTPDQFLPSHAAMVHGLLGGADIEINSAAGVCVSGMNALKYGFMAVKSQMAKNAVCTGSERVSTWMQSDKFEAEIENLKNLEEQPIIAFKKDFLRWMLSDGAGAVLLENQPNGKFNLEINWMESYSYANEIEACMYAGGDKLDDGSIKPWSNYKTSEWLSNSIFAIKQDVKLLDEHILIKGVQSMANAMKKHQISPNDIDYFLPHVSSHYFVEGLYNEFVNIGLEITKDKWFMNLAKVGNVGAASIFLMLEELFHSGKLKKGDRIMCSVPESGRFSYAYAYLTVC